MKHLLNLGALAIAALFLSACVSNKRYTESVKSSTVDSLIYNKDNSNASVDSSTVERIQTSHGSKETTFDMSIIDNLKERITSLENIDINKKTYYDTGVLKSETVYTKSNRVDTDKERLIDLQLDVRRLENYIDSIYSLAHDIHINLEFENERLRNIIRDHSETEIMSKTDKRTVLVCVIIFGIAIGFISFKLRNC